MKQTMKQTVLWPEKEIWWNKVHVQTISKRLPAEAMLPTADVALAMHSSNEKCAALCECGELLAFNLAGPDERAFWRIFRPGVLAFYELNLECKNVRDASALFVSHLEAELAGGTYISTAAVAAFANCCPEKINSMCAAKLLPAANLNKHTDKRACWRIYRAGVMEFFKRQIA